MPPCSLTSTNESDCEPCGGKTLGFRVDMWMPPQVPCGVTAPAPRFRSDAMICPACTSQRVARLLAISPDPILPTSTSRTGSYGFSRRILSKCMPIISSQLQKATSNFSFAYAKLLFSSNHRVMSRIQTFASSMGWARNP